MSEVTSTNALAKDSTLQDVADAIETMSATSVGNMAALQTTDKTSLVGAVNELKSGLTNKVLGTISGTNVPCNVESTVHYTEGNTYNVWTTHTFTFGDMTSIAGAYLQAVNHGLISDGIKHEAELLSIVGNVVTYAVKGAWSGGAAGVNVMIVAFGV